MESLRVSPPASEALALAAAPTPSVPSVRPSHERWPYPPKRTFPCVQSLRFPRTNHRYLSAGFLWPGTSAAVASLLIWCSDPPGDAF